LAATVIVRQQFWMALSARDDGGSGFVHSDCRTDFVLDDVSDSILTSRRVRLAGNAWNGSA
jgi:hypothetical protein